MKKAKNQFLNRMKLISGLLLVFAGALFTLGLVNGIFDPSFGLIAIVPLAWIVDGKFKELSADDMKEFTAEQLAGYYNAMNEHKRKELQTAIEAKATKDDLDKLKGELEAMQKLQLKSLNDALAAQGLMIKRFTEQERKQGKKSLSEQITEALEAKKEALTAFKEKRDKSTSLSFDLALKVGTMTNTGNVSGGNVPVEDREDGLNVIATRRPYILSLISRGSTVSQVVSWVEQQNKDGGAGGTAEGEKKNQADFDLVVVSESVKKRTVYIKVSNEMLDDISFIESEIRTELMKLLDLDIDNQILLGDNLNQNLNGILTQATAYAAGGFANAIDLANNYDVLRTAIDQVVIAHHNPTIIVMHPSDVTAMELVKDSTGQYVLPPFIASNGMNVSGIRIVENTGMTIDNFLVMDGSKAKAFFRKNIGITMGFENDDFTRNLVTILAEARLLLRIKGNDDTAFVTGDFTTAKAALETP